MGGLTPVPVRGTRSRFSISGGLYLICAILFTDFKDYDIPIQLMKDSHQAQQSFLLVVWLICLPFYKKQDEKLAKLNK